MHMCRCRCGLWYSFSRSSQVESNLKQQISWTFWKRHGHSWCLWLGVLFWVSWGPKSKLFHCKNCYISVEKYLHFFLIPCFLCWWINTGLSPFLGTERQQEQTQNARDRSQTTNWTDGSLRREVVNSNMNSILSQTISFSFFNVPSMQLALREASLCSI